MPAALSSVSLLNKTLDLLRADKRRLSVLAREAKMPYAWLYAVKRGNIANPGVEQVEKLFQFLTKNKQ